MNTKEITVLMVEPGQHPKVTTLKDDLDSLQKAVSIGADYQGLIEFVSLGNGDCIMCNEEGKLIGLEGNRRLGNDILVGVFYIISENDDGNLISLSEQKIKHYSNVLSLKIMFVLKDVDDQSPEFYYERGVCDEVIKSTNSGNTWNPIVEWACKVFTPK